jgi:hypothetical protein
MFDGSWRSGLAVILTGFVVVVAVEPAIDLGIANY